MNPSATHMEMGTRVLAKTDFAHDVDVLLDAMHLERVVLGGLSMGGYAAFAGDRVMPNESAV